MSGINSQHTKAIRSEIWELNARMATQFQAVDAAVAAMGPCVPDMTFDPVLMEQARREITGALYGQRTAKAKQWAVILKISPQHIYRLIKDRTKKRDRKSSAVRPEYQTWANTIFQIKNRPPEEAGVISTEDAITLALKSGLVPPEAADVPVSTYNIIGRKNGWTKRETRAVRFQAERPNQAHHFDASTSKFLYIAKKIGDEYVLRLHRPAKHYKNKPIPVDALRPWIYGLVDDHSGRWTARYVAAQGENSADSMSFLAWAWAEMGLCEQLLADQGMLKKALPSRDLVERLGVELPEMMPYAKRGHGKIEKPWSTCWRKFEMPFFATSADWRKFEISLTELNQQLANYAVAYNQMPHRFEREITRMQAWNRVNLHGGIVKIPENALATVARRAKRKIGVDGILNYEGKAYEVKGLYDAEVWVYENVFAEKAQALVVQDCATGKKYEVRDFKPLGLGEFRSFKETPHQQIVKASENLPLSGRGLYAEKKGAINLPALPTGQAGGRQGPAPAKVVAMPIRTKEERIIEDPFDVDTYPTVVEAMKDFMGYIPGVFLSREEREEVEGVIEANGLSRKFVENFALEVRAQMSKREAM